MPPGDDSIHLLLRVEAAGLKVLGHPSQDGEPLLALDRDAEQPSRDVDEVFQHSAVVAFDL